MASHAQLTAREISGPLNQILTNLSGDNGREWLDAYNRVNRKENPWPAEKVTAQAVTDLLGPAADLCTAPAYARFVTREHFGNKKTKVKTYLYGNFEKHLLNLIEEDISEESLKVRPLNRASRDTPILTELGEKQETKLAHVWYALESGSLRKDAYYLFYVRDADNVLWAVSVDWSGGGWHVGAFSVDRPFGWLAGRLVVSR